MKKFTLTLILISLLVLSACTAKDTEEEYGVPEVVHVDILVPETISPQEEAMIQIKISQGNENVEDAQETDFEIWQHEQRGEGDMISAVHQGEGIYQISHTFKEDGVFYVQTHVTARDMHAMPTKQLIVGDVSEEELEELEEEPVQEESGAHGHH